MRVTLGGGLLGHLQRTAVHPGDQVVEIHGESTVCERLFTQ